jgi:uncharacterized delta-60 repeat protein
MGCFGALGRLVLAAGIATGMAGAAAAADGDLDADDFYPPNGRIGMVGGGLLAEGGLVAPDGMAVVTFRGDGAEVRWRQVPPEIGPAVSCSFAPPLATDARYRDGLFDAEGRLVLVGSAAFPGLGDVAFVVRWLYPDCTLDPAFSDDGYFTFDLAEDVRALRVRTQTAYVLNVPVERLVVAGDVETAGGSGDLDTLVLRLRGDGTLDPTFDGDGWAAYDDLGESQLLADFVVDGERRIVLGVNVDVFTADSDFVLGRLTPDGELDPTFGVDGWWRLRFASEAADLVGAMEAAPNGDVLFAGTTDVGDERRIGIGRLRTSVTYTSIPTAGDLLGVTSATLQGDRKLIVAGWSNGYDGDVDVFAVRVDVPEEGAMLVDPTFGDGADPQDPLTYFSFEAAHGGTDAAYAVELSGGKPVLFGEANFGDPQGTFVARLENAYIFVDGFESGSTNAW